MAAEDHSGAAENMLDSLMRAAEGTSDGLSRIGARVVVLCKFVDAVFPELTAAQCKRLIPIFRQGIENAMSQTDDIVTPPAYQATLLEQTNVLLAALQTKSTVRC